MPAPRPRPRQTASGVSRTARRLGQVGAGEKHGTTLSDCVKRHCGGVLNTQTFIDETKKQPEFAMEYAARLLRFSFAWDGPIKRHEVDPSLSRDAMKELQALLA